MKCAEIHLTQRKEHDEVGVVRSPTNPILRIHETTAVYLYTMLSHETKKKRLETFQYIYIYGWLIGILIISI